MLPLRLLTVSSLPISVVGTEQPIALNVDGIVILWWWLLIMMR
jgi:hypothetical protein